MRKIIIGLLLLLSFGASAQWQQTGSKVRYVNGLGIPTKDTAAGVAADSSQIVIRPADSALYIKYKRTWLRVGGGGGSIAGGGTAGQVSFFTSASAIGGDNGLFWDNTNKRLGINTVLPGKSLDIHSSGGVIAQFNGTTTNNAYLDFQNAGSTKWRIGNTYSAGAQQFQLNNAASTNVVTINQSGAIGVGTTNPGGFTGLLALRNDTGVCASFNSINTNGASIDLLNIGVDSYRISMPSTTGNLAFLSSSTTPRMTLLSTGNIGIGYNAPAAKLSVDGTTLINTNTDNGLGDKLQVSGSAIATRLKVNTSGQTLNISTYYNGGNGNNLWINNTEPPLTSAAENNVGIGIDAMISNTSGSFNYALGGRALQRNTSGGLNTAIGFGALEYHTTGTRNTGIGVNALNSIVSSTDNIGIGSYALQFTTGNKNVAIGSQVMYENTTGSSNIAFGLDAGRKISGGSANQTSNQSIFIGEDTRASAAGNTNEMVFGHTAIGQGSNTVTLGNSSITKTFLRGNTMVNTTTDNGVDKLQVNGSVNATTQILNGTGTTTTLSLQAANGVGTLRWLNGAGTSTWATYSPAGSSLVFRDVVNSSDVLTLAAGGLATFGSSVEATQFKLSALNTAPSSAGDTGTLGEIRIDANYIYICTATNTWKRVAIATW